MSDLFVYGSLRNPEIVFALTGKTFRMSSADLDGYFVSTVSGRATPEMVKSQDAIAKGVILHDVDEQTMDIIAAWEDTDYTKRAVSVRKTPATGAIPCYTFVWNSEVIGSAWDNDAFRNQHMQWYLDVDIPDFLKAYRASASANDV